MSHRLAVLILVGCAALARASAADPPLIESIKAGDLAGLKARLAAGADVGAIDRFSWTAVMWASGHADGATLKALLDAGGDPAPKEPAAWSAIVEAAKGGRAENVALLAGKGLDCSAKDDVGVPAIAYAATVSTQTVAALLACKAKRSEEHTSELQSLV